MNEFFTELKTIIRGEVLADNESLELCAKDRSIFRVLPSAIVLPKDADDIVSLVRWVREKKKENPANAALSITARGNATDTAGGPLNEGIIVRFPGCLDKILEIGNDFVRVEPGALVRRVNEALAPHGRFLPFYAEPAGFVTVGGAVASNAVGEKAVKYGSCRLYIKTLKMVLASGAEVAVTPLLSGDLALKKQQINFEGDIYRAIDELLKTYRTLLQETRPRVNNHASGYNLWDVKRFTDEGKVFDLIQLIAGSQGTLGILTEVSFWTLPKPMFTGAMFLCFDDLAKMGEAIFKLVELGPSSLEMADRFFLEIVAREKPEILDVFAPGKIPEFVIFCEFDENDAGEIEEKLAEAEQNTAGLSYENCRVADSEAKQRLLNAIRFAPAVIERIQGKKKAIPFIEDVIVPLEKLPEYILKLYEIMRWYGVEIAVHGHVGGGNVRAKPLLDIGDEADREKLFAMAGEVFDLAANLGGVFSGEHNDGIMRTPYLAKLYPKELLLAWKEVKKIFDPQGIFNPGKKVAIDLEYAKSHLRNEYEI